MRHFRVPPTWLTIGAGLGLILISLGIVVWLEPSNWVRAGIILLTLAVILDYRTRFCLQYVLPGSLFLVQTAGILAMFRFSHSVWLITLFLLLSSAAVLMLGSIEAEHSCRFKTTCLLAIIATQTTLLASTATVRPVVGAALAFLVTWGARSLLRASHKDKWSQSRPYVMIILLLALLVVISTRLTIY